MKLVRYTYPTTRHFGSNGAFSRLPWSGLESEIDRLFQAAFTELPNAATDGAFAVDLYEDKDNMFVRAELPGVERDAINVEVVNGYLTLQASRKTGGSDGEQSTSFSRSVSLSEDVQTDRVSANYENGVLTVTLPKKEEAKPKKVTVQIS